MRNCIRKVTEIVAIIAMFLLVGDGLGCTQPLLYAYAASVTGNDSQTDMLMPDGKTVSSNASNQKEQEKLLQMVMPNTIKLTIDPYRIWGGEQIFSEEIIIENHSTFAVIVTFHEIECSMPQEEQKTCELYLHWKDSDDKFSVGSGKQTDIDELVIPAGGNVVYYLEGSVTQGSEALWKADDIKLNMIFQFREKQTG